jgi:uncharacterized protein YPO0396
MKALTRIRLINWHLFENTTINCQGTTYFIGINGAGKSTILDALQFALVGGQRDVRFNQAALRGGKRTLASYVRGELGTEGQRYLRGDATGVVALEFRNPDGTTFVHGALVDAFEDRRTPEVAYFIVHNASLDDDWFFRAPGQLFDTRAFKRHLEHFALPSGGRAQLFTRVEDYRFHLLNRLGQLKDTFCAKIVKGLAFSPLTDIRSFVQDYLLDENLVDVKVLQAQLETLRHFESLATDVRERIAALDRIEEHDKERAANRRRRITNGYIARRGQGDRYSAELKDRRLQLDEARLALSRAELQRETLAQNLRFAQSALLDAQVALQTDQAASREKELRQAIASLDVELEMLQKRRFRFEQALGREIKDARMLVRMLEADGLDAPASLLELTETPKGTLLDPGFLQKCQADLSALAQGYAQQEALLDERLRQQRAEAAALEDEIRKLRTGDREASYEAEAPQAARLRRLLRAELGLGANEVVFLSSVLKIPDPAWQDAVEGVLGRNRFTLLLPQAHYAAAMQIYQQRRQADGLHGVALLDAERILEHAEKQKKFAAYPDSLASEVHSDHPTGRALVDLLLSHHVKCDRLDELRAHRTAVTRDCFVRRNFSDSHLDPRVYRRWFIGERAVPRQVEQRQARLDEIAAEITELDQRSSALQERLALSRDKLRPFVEIEHALEGLERLPQLEVESESLGAELAALDLSTVDSLQAEVERHQADANRVQAELAAFERQVGNQESNIRTLESDLIPALERQVDQAQREAEIFLDLEDAHDDLEADILAEYNRRLERQPVDVILANATRYENDYQTAEQRARDRLREAKQSYSLRYDFGYDDQDDADRYLAERAKLVDSELPEYEAQIAHQRALAEGELVENFIHRLREQIEDARQQLAFLNVTLSQLRFGGERFEFIAQPAPNLRQVYDMIMDSQNVLGDSLFTSDFRQVHQQGWDLLFERLTAAYDEENAELRELQDYRNYLQYDIRVHYPNGDRALLSHISAKKSGGETTTPFYVAMAASFAQAYRLHQPRPSDTIRLALFDEAFSKMDTARTASALQFMRQAGLQVLLATPPDKSGSLLPFVDSVCTVVRKNSHAFVIEIDKAELANACLEDKGNNGKSGGNGNHP